MDTIRKIDKLLLDNGCEILETSKNGIKYESKDLIISLGYNPFENSNTFWLESKKSKDSIEIDNKVMYEFFGSNLKFENLNKEELIHNSYLFLSGVGNKILNGDKRMIKKLIKFKKVENDQYTSKLIDSQNLKKANLAWNNKIYNNVVKYLSMVDEQNMSESLKKNIKFL
jgi:hypothetical protein